MTTSAERTVPFRGDMQQTPDTPVEILGFATDPTLVGYQLLTNYESTYWRALAGAGAWGLYEVLRSFCHEGNDTCHPSINLLMAILGIKDRSVIIGRSSPKIVDGKAYFYPGLIEVLQEHDLVIAETSGEGPTLRYTFHVNLTPGQLTPAQLAQLPEVLQTKHAQLLARCQEKVETLKARKRPSKVPEPEDDGPAPAPDDDANEGIGNSNTPIGISNTPPLGNSNTPSGNFQDKQYPVNTTHKDEQYPKNNNHARGRSRKTGKTARANSGGGGSSSSSVPEELIDSFIGLAGHKPDAIELQNLATFAQYEKRIIDETLSAAYDWVHHPTKAKLHNPSGWLVGTARRKVENEQERAEREKAARAVLSQKGGKDYVPAEYADIIIH